MIMNKGVHQKKITPPPSAHLGDIKRKESTFSSIKICFYKNVLRLGVTIKKNCFYKKQLRKIVFIKNSFSGHAEYLLHFV